MLDIVKVLLQWKKQIVLLTLAGILVSVVVTMPFIMPPYYKSKMVFYMSNPQSTDRAALFNEKEVGGISIFGGKEDMNRFLSILNSSPASLMLIQKYNLGKHYNIDAGDTALFTYYTQKEFNSNFDAIRNDLGAIEVSIIDTDPKLAAVLTRSIVQYADSVYRTILIENKATVLALLDRQITQKQQQAGVVNQEELLKMISIRDQYAVSSSDAFKTLYVVEEPVPAVKKFKPVRWLIVSITASASLILACLLALVIELFRHADQ